MINSHKVTKHACTSSWLPLAHSIHHTHHQVTVMNKQQKKQRLYTTHIYIYIHISCKCDTNRAGHFTLDAHASRPVACVCILMPLQEVESDTLWFYVFWCFSITSNGMKTYTVCDHRNQSRYVGVSTVSQHINNFFNHNRLFVRF